MSRTFRRGAASMGLDEVAGEPAGLLAALEREQAAKWGVSAPLGFRIPA